MSKTEALHIHAEGSGRWGNAPAVPRRVISPYLDPVLVEPGEYNAVLVGHRGVNVFRTQKVLTLWRLLEHGEIVVPRYYRVKAYRPRICAPASSDIVREVEAVLDRRVRRDQIPIESMQGIVVRLEVCTVTCDRAQRELRKVSQYSKVERVIGRA